MKIVVFSDLDATLLDPESYSWRPAQRAVETLRMRDASLVMVTSKTLAEVKPLHEELGFDDPFVVENGGGIAFHKGAPLGEDLLSSGSEIMEFHRTGVAVLAFGTRYEVLVKSLAEISAEVGAPLLGFSGMSLEQVAKATGLPLEQAAKARVRLFDEPFLIPEGQESLEPEIRNAAGLRGLHVVEGGRFLHLIGHSGKGKAVSIVLEGFQKRYGDVVSIGLGDSPNDFPFLRLVDIPVLLGQPRKTPFVRPLFERARQYDISGPEGWNQAVLDVLTTL
jgi:mannosyl-3-phosphoglycerate phosphatase